jgi:hypothetical protein
MACMYMQEGERNALNAEEKFQYRNELESNLLRALADHVVNVECRRLSVDEFDACGTRVIAQCVATLKVSALHSHHALAHMLTLRPWHHTHTLTLA